MCFILFFFSRCANVLVVQIYICMDLMCVNMYSCNYVLCLPKFYKFSSLFTSFDVQLGIEKYLSYPLSN